MAAIDPVTFAKAMADETRQNIMWLLCCQRLCVGDIVEQINVTQPTVSHHLGILRDAGLVTVERVGKQVYYTLNQDVVAFCCGTIMQKFAPAKAKVENGEGRVAAALVEA